MKLQKNVFSTIALLLVCGFVQAQKLDQYIPVRIETQIRGFGIDEFGLYEGKNRLKPTPEGYYLCRRYKRYILAPRWGKATRGGYVSFLSNCPRISRDHGHVFSFSQGMTADQIRFPIDIIPCEDALNGPIKIVVRGGYLAKTRSASR